MRSLHATPPPPPIRPIPSMVPSAPGMRHGHKRGEKRPSVSKQAVLRSERGARAYLPAPCGARGDAVRAQGTLHTRVHTP